MKKSSGMKHGLIVMVLVFGLLVGSAFAALPDSDNDGVPDSQDVCPTGTRLKELVPADSLGTNRFALTNGDRVFDTTPSKGKGPRNQYSVDGSVGSSTCGCSCEQILAFSTGEKTGLVKSGCTIGIMDNFVNSRCLVDKDNDGYKVSQGDCNDNNPAISPGAREACNGVDDNCNGVTDEGNPGGGAACPTGQPGVCAAGTTQCTGGALVCTPSQLPSAEVCDGLDNDCNGVVDNGIAPVPITCGTGACAGTGQQTCVNGQLQDQCTPLPAGTVCGSSGSACMNPDTCDTNGQCQMGTPLDCDDNNPGTTDTCNPVLGCVHVPVSCSDGIDCTADTFNPATGQCVSLPDNSVCPSADTCHLGSCDPTSGCVQTDVDCDDRNACTVDRCNALLGCVNTPVNCDDNNPCTLDSCDAATGCLHREAPAGTACDDGDACTTRDQCSSGGVCLSGSTLTCDDGNSCTLDSCDSLSGCQYQNRPAGSVCDDGDACTTGDRCSSGGVCLAGSTLTCDDGNSCTADSCDPQTGCKVRTLPAGSVCDDGDACTVGDSCTAGGICQAGSPRTCDDNNTCTEDSCDPLAGCQVQNLPAGTECGDGNECTAGDWCSSGGVCQPGTPLTCDDGNPCTSDSCDAVFGCVHPPLMAGSACDDGNECTTGETCQSGSCAGGSPLSCDDGIECTINSCDPATGCIFNVVPDGTWCTQGQCFLGICQPPTTEAPVEPPPQDETAEGDPCTTGQPGACAAGTMQAGGGGLVCTPNQQPSAEACDGVDNDCDGTVDNGVQSACDDGNPCNGFETCSAGACQTGTPIICDWGYFCHSPSGLCAMQVEEQVPQDQPPQE